MAVLQTIREKYAKVAGFVIALSLVGFIAMDAGSGSMQDLFGADNGVAKVGGEKVSQEEFSDRVQDYETLRTFFSKGQPVNAEQRAQNSEEALRSLIMDKQIAGEAQKLGLSVTDVELRSLYTASPMNQTFSQFFSVLGLQENDPQIAQLVKELDKPTITDPQVAQIAPIWVRLKEFVRRDLLTQKYSALITSGVITPQFVLDRMMIDETQIANVKVVKVPFTTIPDAEVKVTDADINSYIEGNKVLFRVDDPSRSIEYVAFQVMPDAADTTTSLGELEKLKGEFTTVPESEVENFVNRGHSDEQYNNAWVTKKSFMSPITDSVFNMPVGTVVGPYLDQGNFKLTKIVAKSTLPDSVSVRHILVKYADQGQVTITDSAAKTRIDSIKTAIENGAEFGAMAQSTSDDLGSKDSGGKYEFSLEQRSSLTVPFGDFIFEGKPGDKKIVKVESGGYSGYHYIEILSQKGTQTAAKIATLVKGLNAGSKANSKVYSQANSFAGANNDGAKWDELIKKENLNKRVAERIIPGAFTIEGLGPARELIRWAYTAKLGEVSSAFTIGDNQYVVARVTGINEPGLLKLNENNRQQLESIVKEEMKAKKITEKYKAMTNLEAIATASGQQVMTADSIRLSSNQIGNIGQSAAAVGYAFNPKFALNTVSPALRGQDGVYFITVTNRGQLEGQDPGMAAQIRMMQDMQAKNSVGQNVMGVIQKLKPVKYKPDNIR